MGTSETSRGIAQLGALIADESRVEILCALMDGRAHTGSELSRHVGIAASTTSEHLSKLLDARVVVVEAQGRHRYWRLADRRVAELLESLGAHATHLAEPRAPAELTHARTCYDHLAGELAVAIYERLLADRHLDRDGEHLTITSSGYDLLRSVGADIGAIQTSTRTRARPCLDWTQRRHHLAGASGSALLAAFRENDWITTGTRPRSVRITETGRTRLTDLFSIAL